MSEQETKQEFATESFNIDHTTVSAPYIRTASIKTGKNGDTVVKYDIRFCQPNFECMDTDEIHTLEHLTSEILHANYPEIIDFSPMGCRTGFYLTMFDGFTEERIAQIMVSVMQKIATWSGQIPGHSETSCGNYKDHNIFKAKKRAMMFIGGIMSKGYAATKEN